MKTEIIKLKNYYSKEGYFQILTLQKDFEKLIANPKIIVALDFFGCVLAHHQMYYGIVRLLCAHQFLTNARIKLRRIHSLQRTMLYGQMFVESKSYRTPLRHRTYVLSRQYCIDHLYDFFPDAQAICDYLGISRCTLENWKYEKDGIPEWAFNILNEACDFKLPTDKINVLKNFRRSPIGPKKKTLLAASSEKKT